MQKPENRPQGAAPEQTAKSTSSILPPVTVEDWERAATAVNGCFVAVLYIDSDKVRRRTFLTLAAAQRHVDRARERGHEASVVLAELRPCFVLPAVVR